MDDVKKLRDSMYEIAREIKSLDEQRRANDGKWTDETRQRSSELLKKHQQVSAELQQAEDIKREREMLSLMSADSDPQEPLFRKKTDIEKYTGNRITRETSCRALRAWLMPEQADSKDHESAQMMGIDVRRKQLRMRLLDTACKSVSEIDDAIDEMRSEQRAQATSPGSAGGFITEPNTLRALEIALLHYAPIRQYATVYRTATGSDVPIPTTNDTGNVAEIVSENTQVNEQDIAFGQVILSPWMYHSKLVRVSWQLMQDAVFNVPQLVGRLLGERIGRKQSTDFTVGAGTTEPRGYMLDAADSGVVLASNTAITLAELTNIKYGGIDSAYEPNAMWSMPRSKVGLIAGMTAENGGNSPVWMPRLADDIPGTILGDPYFENPAIVDGTSSKSIAYGDHSKYHIADATEVIIQRLDERYAEFLQVAFHAVQRSDGALVDAGTGPLCYATNAV